MELRRRFVHSIFADIIKMQAISEIMTSSVKLSAFFLLILFRFSVFVFLRTCYFFDLVPEGDSTYSKYYSISTDSSNSGKGWGGVEALYCWHYHVSFICFQFYYFHQEIIRLYYFTICSLK